MPPELAALRRLRVVNADRGAEFGSDSHIAGADEQGALLAAARAMLHGGNWFLDVEAYGFRFTLYRERIEYDAAPPSMPLPFDEAE